MQLASTVHEAVVIEDIDYFICFLRTWSDKADLLAKLEQVFRKVVTHWHPLGHRFTPKVLSSSATWSSTGFEMTTMTIKLKIICIRKIEHLINWPPQPIIAMAIVTYQNWAYHFLEWFSRFSCVENVLMGHSIGVLFYTRKKVWAWSKLIFHFMCCCSFGCKQKN